MLNAALLATYAPRRYGAGGDPTPPPVPLPPGAPAPNVAFSPVVSATPTTVMIHVEGLTANPNDPTYVQLRAAFLNARVGGSVDDTRGNWVGPGPRVVRADYSVPASYRVSAAWLYQFPVTNPATTPALADELARNVLREMQTLVTYSNAGWHVQKSPYNAAINGPISWWACATGGADCAQITRTRDSSNVLLPTVGEAHENALGPTTARTQPPSGNPLDGVTTALKWGLGIAAAGVGGWLAIKAYEASKTAKRAVTKDEP